MLFQLLDELCGRIDRLDAAAEAPRFAAQLHKMRPTLKAELKAKGMAAHQLEKAVWVLSTAQLGVIKGIPAIAAEMSKPMAT